MTAAPFETKTDWVYARLRGRIVHGDLPAGARLRLEPLAREFATSPMPVREALRMLQQDGLVEFESHRGAAVAEVTLDRAYEAVLIRMHLEVLAVRHATPHHDERSVDRLSRLLDRMDETARRRQATRYSDGNREFHTSLYETGPYELLKDQIRELWDFVWRMRSRSLFALRPDRAPAAQREHRRILEAVRQGDPDGAAAAAVEHRENTLAAWSSVLRARESLGG
jgi:DNA-binding GntR family transcriptional regulator